MVQGEGQKCAKSQSRWAQWQACWRSAQRRRQHRRPRLAIIGTGPSTYHRAGPAGGADNSCATARLLHHQGGRHRRQPGWHGGGLPGTYAEQVVVTKRLNLFGTPGATVNAKGQTPLRSGRPSCPAASASASFVPAAPGSAVSRSPASFDAILVAASSHVWYRESAVDNGDVGVDINGSSWSPVTHNFSAHNEGGGFLVADDIGANSHNVVGWNIATRNPGGCGVIIAGHSTAGVRGNLVIDNWLSYNGTLKSSGGGAGVVIASEVPTRRWRTTSWSATTSGATAWPA